MSRGVCLLYSLFLRIFQTRKNINMNHKFVLSVLSLFLVTNLSAQQGISFVHSFKEAMAIAKKENKLIFMDAYTTWCGPCKKLNREVFNKKEVGEYFNENFINLKMDMEKGEGIALTDQYRIYLYPTLLFIDQNGKEVHRAAGYRTVPQFMDLGKAALDPSRQSASMAEQYAEGKREPAFLLEYATSLYESGKGGQEGVISEFLETQEDWSEEMNLKLIYKMVETVDSPLFAYLSKNQAQFEKFLPAAQVKGRLDNIIYASIYQLGENPDLNSVKSIFEKAYPGKSDKLFASYKMRNFIENENPTAFAKAATQYVKKYKIKDADELNEIAWNFYESVDDKKLLKKGLKIAKKSVKAEKNYYNLDTMAALLYRLNKKKKAIKVANKAIALGKKNGEDISSTENLLKQIEKL